MAQHDYVIANGTGAAVRSDLNNALAAIVSQNSGATAPSTTYAYQWWADTTTGLLKLRNAANNAWITLRELDGTLTVEDGTAAAPGLAFTSDLNTGIFRAGADQFNIATNGVERVEFGTSEVVFNDGGANYDFRIEGDTNANLFFVDASAEAVGIGTTLPTANLELGTVASANQSLRINSAGNNYLELSTTGATGEHKITAGNSASGTAQLIFETASGGTESERARIDSSGRLLVGTSTARGSARFQVEGTDVNGSTITTTRNSADASPSVINLKKSRGTTAGSYTVVADNDRVGVLAFYGADGSADIQLAGIDAYVDGTPGANDMPGRLVFSTTADGASSPTERMRLKQNGEFVCGGIYSFTTANAANVNIDSSGELRRSTSSSKYKTNIETIESSYSDALLNCRPVWYQSTSNKDNPDWGWWGFIAEEVAEIDPRLVYWKTVDVTYDDNGAAVQTPCDPEPEGVAYDRFVPHLLNLIKRQGESIAELQAEVAALKAS